MEFSLIHLTSPAACDSRCGSPYARYDLFSDEEAQQEILTGRSRPILRLIKMLTQLYPAPHIPSNLRSFLLAWCQALIFTLFLHLATLLFKLEKPPS